MDLLNAHSVVNKGSLVQDIIVSQNLDVLAVTETWIICDDSDAVKLILVSSLTMHFIFGVFLQCKSDILYEHADIWMEEEQDLWCYVKHKKTKMLFSSLDWILATAKKRNESNVSISALSLTECKQL